MTDLKPCPFCPPNRSRPTAQHGIDEEYLYHGSWYVSCSGCRTLGPPHPHKSKAIAAWNHRASDWISVEERLPETGRGVLVHGGMAYLSDQDRAWHSMIDGNRRIQWAVTHWMPLPEPQEEGG